MVQTATTLLVFDQRTGGEATLEHCGASLPHRIGGFRAEQKIVDLKVPGELQVAPMVQGVAQQVGHDAREGVELLPVGRVPGTKAFSNAVGAHLAPLVVVAVEPDLGDVLPVGVCGDLGRRKVGVKVDDRQLGRVVEVEADRLVVLKQEPFVDQTTHPAAARARTSSSVHLWFSIRILFVNAEAGESLPSFTDWSAWNRE